MPQKWTAAELLKNPTPINHPKRKQKHFQELSLLIQGSQGQNPGPGSWLFNSDSKGRQVMGRYVQHHIFEMAWTKLKSEARICAQLLATLAGRGFQ